MLWSEPLTGKVGVSVKESHCGVDIAEFLRVLSDETYPDAKTIVRVCDTLRTHGAHFLYGRFSPAEAHRIKGRFEGHFTPEHGSWLNVAECELSVLSRHCLSRRIADLDPLQSEGKAWQEGRNARPVKVNWQFSTEDARTKLRHLAAQKQSDRITKNQRD